jgi:hypothetical protein
MTNVSFDTELTQCALHCVHRRDIPCRYKLIDCDASDLKVLKTIKALLEDTAHDMKTAFRRSNVPCKSAAVRESAAVVYMPA